MEARDPIIPNDHRTAKKFTLGGGGGISILNFENLFLAGCVSVVLESQRRQILANLRSSLVYKVSFRIARATQ